MSSHSMRSGLDSGCAPLLLLSGGSNTRRSHFHSLGFVHNVSRSRGERGVKTWMCLGFETGQDVLLAELRNIERGRMCSGTTGVRRPFR